MTKRDYSAAFRDFKTQKQTVQNTYIRLACEIEPAIVETLPLESFFHLTRNHNDFETNGKTAEIPSKQRKLLLSEEPIKKEILFEILPNADKSTVFDDFQNFKQLFSAWLKKYCFEKDWIVKSALSTLDSDRQTFIKGETIKPRKYLISFTNASAHFTFGGLPPNAIGIQSEMKIYNENWTEFENRIKQQMKELKKRYLEKAKNETYQTNNFDMQQLKWLVLWNIKPKWTTYDIARNETLDNEEISSIEKKIDNVKNEFRKGKSKVFDLPVRMKRKVYPKKSAKNSKRF